MYSQLPLISTEFPSQSNALSSKHQDKYDYFAHLLTPPGTPAMNSLLSATSMNSPFIQDIFSPTLDSASPRLEDSFFGTPFDQLAMEMELNGQFQYQTSPMDLFGNYYGGDNITMGMDPANVNDAALFSSPIDTTAERALEYSCHWMGCAKTFGKEMALNSHLKSHSSEKSFICGECNAGFKRGHDLKRHARSLHSKLRSFACNCCQKKFSRLDALKRHTSRVKSQCHIA